MVPDGVDVGLPEAGYPVIEIERPLAPTDILGLME
jgi:hypothetical protein